MIILSIKAATAGFEKQSSALVERQLNLEALRPYTYKE